MPEKSVPYTEATPRTMKEIVFRAYSNCGMAIATLHERKSAYDRLSYMIRARLYKGLITGTMKVSSIFSNERQKMTLPICCYYCGCSDDLALDHLIPTKLGGTDSGDNFVYACRTCNSSKGGTDLLQWMTKNDQFPTLHVFERYLKLAIRHCDTHGLWDKTVEECQEPGFPFRLELLPHDFPPLDTLQLFVEAKPPKIRSHRLRGMIFAFTGELFGLTRRQAITLIEQHYGDYRPAVSSHVTHLVVAQTRWDDFRSRNKETSKIKNALCLQSQEHPIRIIPEIEFLTIMVCDSIDF